MGRLRKFGELTWKEQVLVAEAYFMHLTTGLILKVIPFRWIPWVFSSRQSAVGSRQFDSPTEEENQSRKRSVGTSVLSPQSRDIELIRVAIQRAGRVSPWRNRCLVSSLAGRCMLRRRKIDSQLSIGVAKEDGGKVIAHAWLNAGEAEIVPKGGDFQELYRF